MSECGKLVQNEYKKINIKNQTQASEDSDTLEKKGVNDLGLTVNPLQGWYKKRKSPVLWDTDKLFNTSKEIKHAYCE